MVRASWTAGDPAAPATLVTPVGGPFGGASGGTAARSGEGSRTVPKPLRGKGSLVIRRP